VKFGPTDSNARRAKCWYLAYSEDDFEVFVLRGQHVGPMGMKLGTEEWQRFTPTCPISHPLVQIQGYGSSKTENFSEIFSKFWNTNTQEGRIRCAIFTKFAAFAGIFRMR